MAQTQFISSRSEDVDPRPLTNQSVPVKSLFAYAVFSIAFAFTAAMVLGVI